MERQRPALQCSLVVPTEEERWMYIGLLDISDAPSVFSFSCNSCQGTEQRFVSLYDGVIKKVRQLDTIQLGIICHY